MNWPAHLALQVDGTLTAGSVAAHAPAPTSTTGRVRPPRFTAGMVERLNAELMPMGRPGRTL
jgi:hypothetical protein